jgi:hypothetical protein
MNKEIQLRQTQKKFALHDGFKTIENSITTFSYSYSIYMNENAIIARFHSIKMVTAMCLSNSVPIAGAQHQKGIAN